MFAENLSSQIFFNITLTVSYICALLIYLIKRLGSSLMISAAAKNKNVSLEKYETVLVNKKVIYRMCTVFFSFFFFYILKVSQRNAEIKSIRNGA